MSFPFPKLPTFPRRLTIAAAASLCWWAGAGLAHAESPPIPKGTTAPAPATVTGAKTSLWKVKGAKNTVYLLGSVHILRPEDHPLPAAMDAAYADTKVLVLEATSKEAESPETQAL